VAAENTMRFYPKRIRNKQFDTCKDALKEYNTAQMKMLKTELKANKQA
jgi:hypothetical protein